MGFILQDASTGGGGGNSSATAISSATSTNSSAWGTAQNVAFTATGQTLSLPTPISGDIAPVLKTIVITNTGTNAFTIALTGGTITSAVGLVMNPGSIWTITAQTLTSASISSTNAAQGVVPEFGTVYSTGGVTPTGGQFSAATSVIVPGLSFVASSAGTFQIDANILVNVTGPTGGTQGRINFALFDSVTPTVPVANSERLAMLILSGSTAGINESVQGTGALNDVFTLTGGRTYRIQCWNSASNTNGQVLTGGADSRASLAWNKISGQVPSTGQSIQKAEVLLTGLANTAPSAATWTDITPATGITVPANIDVDLGYQCGMSRSAVGLANLRLFNVTDNVAVANTISTIAFEAAAFSGTTTSFKLQVPATTAPKTYKIQYQTNNAGTQALDTANSTAKIWYLQSGSTATITTVRAQVRANTMTGTASAGAGTAVTFGSKELDTTNSFTAATGVFIAPRTGQYQINAQFFVGTSAVGSGGRFGVILSTNGAGFGAGSPIITYFAPVTNPSSAVFGGSYVKTLNAGDALTFRAFLDTATSMSLAGNANFDYITITELNPTF